MHETQYQDTSLSYTEENYLKTIFQSAEESGELVATNTISHLLDTTAASVTDMLKRLADKGLIDYEKYKGVRLTRKGDQIARNLIRKHRLWETFLVDKLRFNWDEVHEIAEQLEHIQSSLLTNRLEEFLGYPHHDPHGDPIPDRKGNIDFHAKTMLADLKVGEEAVIKGVKDTGSKFLQYLDSMKMGLGSAIEVTERIEYDDSIVIRIGGEREVTVSKQVSRNLYVEVIE